MLSLCKYMITDFTNTEAGFIIIFELSCTILVCFDLITFFCLVNTFSCSRTQAVEAAKAEGEKIKLIGTAEAYAIESVGKADAERMRVKAQVYKQYGDAAIMSLVLDALPKV